VGNMPLKPPKMDGNRHFQAKTPKNKNPHISKTINRIKTKFDDQVSLRPTIAHRGWSNIIQIKSNMAAGRHLEKMDMTS